MRIKQPQAKVIVFSAHVSDQYVDAALEAGANGYVSKSEDPKILIHTIRRVVRGRSSFSDPIRVRMKKSSSSTRPHSRLRSLTPRELEILRMIAQGLTRIQIASTLHRSPKTVDNHRAAIMEKLSLRDRVELTRYAIREGLVAI